MCVSLYVCMLCMSVCVCVCACVRACVRACVCVNALCVGVVGEGGCMHVQAYIYINKKSERQQLRQTQSERQSE